MASSLDAVFASYVRCPHYAWPRRVEGNPLVFTALFGDVAYDHCLELMLRTLHDYGGYRGDILMLTDRNEAGVHNNYARLVAGTLHVRRIDFADQDTVMMHRFRLPELGFQTHGPFLHLDSDILVLGPVAGILNAAHNSSRLLVATEDRFCPQYRSIMAHNLPEDGITDWYGVWLLRRRNSAIETLRFANAGAFAFADLPRFRALFADVVTLVSEQRGTRFAHFGDQPVLNVLLHERELGDFTTLDAAMDFLRPIAGRSTLRPFLHFNSINGGVAKRTVMQDFLNRCVAANG